MNPLAPSDLHQTDEVAVYPCGTITRTQFFEIWKGGNPLVISGTNRRLQGQWGPEYFINTHGSLKVAPIDCTTDKAADHARITVSEFFRRFTGEVPCNSAQKLKVRSVSAAEYVWWTTPLIRSPTSGLASFGRLPPELRDSPQGVHDRHAD